jgi:AP2-associated kinase
MASYNSAMPATAPRPAIFGAPVPGHDPAAPAGTFAPGTKIQVGSQKVIIQKYFSEGGFAHVYLVKMPKAIDGTDIAVLKRVAVPDKEHLANMRTEVETMKKLKGHRPIVTYYDSHASQLKGGGYEVFLLMEFCNGGGLIDFMNTRLQNRLTEPEILKIFSDVAEGEASTSRFESRKCTHNLYRKLAAIQALRFWINCASSTCRYNCRRVPVD